MRVALFHNWSMLGSAVAIPLMHAKRDEFLLVAPSVSIFSQDKALLEAARQTKTLHLFPEHVQDPMLFERIKKFGPDLLVVVTFPQKIPPAFLQLPKLAALNLHPSLLPRYRGACPEFWAIRNSETESGVTLHHMTENFDEGAILGQRMVPILADDTLLSLTERFLSPALELVASTLDLYRQGKTPPSYPQDASKATKAPMVKEKHLAIDWTWPAVEIDRLVRAAFPAFEPFFSFRNQRLILRETLPMSLALSSQPGQLVALPAQKRLFVGTGEGHLEFKYVSQPDAMHAEIGWWFWEKFQPLPSERLC